MLVLSRKAEESIVVDGRISITILRIRGNKVQVGVEAPDEVRILRGELDPQQASLLADSQLQALATSGPLVPG